MHAQAARGFRDVEVALGQHFVDALPFQGLDGAGAVGQLYLGVAFLQGKSGCDVVGVGWLGQVMPRAAWACTAAPSAASWANSGCKKVLKRVQPRSPSEHPHLLSKTPLRPPSRLKARGGLQLS